MHFNLALFLYTPVRTRVDVSFFWGTFSMLAIDPQNYTHQKIDYSSIWKITKLRMYELKNI